jgi:hypothetical protein
MNFIKALLYFFTFYLVVFAIKIPLLFIESTAEIIYDDYGSEWTLFWVWLFGGVAITFFFFILSGVSFLMSSFFDKMNRNSFYYTSSIIMISISVYRLYTTWFIIDTFTFPYLGIILKLCYTIAVILLNSVIILTSKRRTSNY